MHIPRPPQPVSRLARGFTLIELIVAVTVLAVLTAIAIPSYTRIVAAQRVRTTSSDLFLSLIRARSEALKRGTNVTLKPASGSSWQNGWKVPDPNSTTVLIDTHGAVSGVTVTGPTSVVYQSSGRLQDNTAASCTTNPPVACFVITSTVTSWSGAASCVSVDVSGRPYSASGVSTC
jgi:type IV fimbrial biogenesis protein FimT